MAVREDLELLFPEELEDTLAEDLYCEPGYGRWMPTWSAACHRQTRTRTPLSTALDRASSPPIDATVQAEVCLVDRGVDAELVTPHLDTTTMTPDQPPLVALPDGWSLAQLAEVAGSHVGQSVPQIMELGDRAAVCDSGHPTPKSGSTAGLRCPSSPSRTGRAMSPATASRQR